MRLTLRCTYPGTDLPPTSVTVEPLGLGDTPGAAHAELVRRIRAGGCFEVPIASGEPLPVWAETVREVVVR